MRHLTRDPDIDAVTALITEAVAELMLPRFGHLRAEDVRSKASASDPEDLVTVVDREMEERLTRGLRDLTRQPSSLARRRCTRRPVFSRTWAATIRCGCSIRWMARAISRAGTRTWDHAAPALIPSEGGGGAFVPTMS
jgi:fructose-1,6-bisphosphatase/inositol monophosphatase family enzyme